MKLESRDNLKISGMQKLTLLDYPGKTACLLFTQGCNFRCPFCHNKDLLKNEQASKIEKNEIFDYLKKRRGLIDGVCISGGEPLLQEDIEEFIKEIKEMGFLVKLDTNGSNPLKLKRLIEQKLVDYIAMDIKNDFLKYDETVGISKLNTQKIKESIEIIENSKIDYEFRTTVVKQLHSLVELEKICKYLGPKVNYCIQNYQNCNTVLKRGLTGFEKEELLGMYEKLKPFCPHIMLRGI